MKVLLFAIFKLGLWGTSDGCAGCSLVTFAFFVYFVVKWRVDDASRRYDCAEMPLRLWLPKVR